jgi:hypothetical protein
MKGICLPVAMPNANPIALHNLLVKPSDALASGILETIDPRTGNSSPR